jgi:hypothetical protein
VVYMSYNGNISDFFRMRVCLGCKSRKRIVMPLSPPLLLFSIMAHKSFFGSFRHRL